MNDIVLSIQRVRDGFDDIPLPTKATHGSAGFDVCAAIQNELIVHPMERVLIPTSFAVAIPEGYEIQVRPRSGLAIKNGITVLNSPGTIDSDYRGEVNIIIINLSDTSVTFKRGDRIAQLVIQPVLSASFELVTKLPETSRGDGGFGHTGR